MCKNSCKMLISATVQKLKQHKYAGSNLTPATALPAYVVQIPGNIPAARDDLGAREPIMEHRPEGLIH